MMTYNLLCDKFFDSRAKHLSADDACRSMDYRLKQILAEIRQNLPDVLCLQEVSVRSAGPTLLRELDALGYEVTHNEYFNKKSDLGHWSRRALNNNHRFWCVLTAVRRCRFSIVCSRVINYYDISYYQYHKVHNSRKQNKGNVVLLVDRHNAANKLIVANTQLYRGKFD